MLTNLLEDPFTGADQSVEVTESYTVPSSGDPYVYLDGIPVDDPSKPVSLLATLPYTVYNVNPEADTTTFEGDSVNRGSQVSMRTGTAAFGTNQRNRALLRFPLSGLPRAGLATVNINLRDTTGQAGFPGLRNVGIHRLTGSFTESTVWSTEPGHDAAAESVVQATTAGFYSWDITDIYNDWIDGVNTNFGVKLIDGNEGETDKSRDWSTKEDTGFKPYLQVIPATDSMAEAFTVLPQNAFEFVVNYSRGVIALHGSLAGGNIEVTYHTRGTNMHAALMTSLFA